jgi:hypothetical protein
MSSEDSFYILVYDTRDGSVDMEFFNDVEKARAFIQTL